MGLDVRSLSMFAVKLSIGDLVEEKVVEQRGCSHDEKPTQFCAECGKPMWVTEETDVLKLVEEGEERYEFWTALGDMGNRWLGPSVFDWLIFEYTRDEWYVGLDLKTGSHRSGEPKAEATELFPFADVKSALISDLKSVGVDVDEDTFNWYVFTLMSN